MTPDEMHDLIESLRWKRRFWINRMEEGLRDDDPERVRTAQENVAHFSEQLIRLTNPNRVRVVTRAKP